MPLGSAALLQAWGPLNPNVPCGLGHCFGHAHAGLCGISQPLSNYVKVTEPATCNIVCAARHCTGCVGVYSFGA